MAGNHPVTASATPRFIEIDPDEPLNQSDYKFREEVWKNLLTMLYRWQLLVLRRLREGWDVIVKAGTGFGKSMIFQSMMFSRPGGIVMVVVPTIAIMKDQVRDRTCTTHLIDGQNERTGHLSD
jgi:ATP-dependent helicase YprA (DUF1998 family)